ncbi:hypothetical protein KTH49_00165 [Acinetobacter parvus]|nr:hypothetical protein [Acinetobacter parvus]MCU4392683.1 hypothetical protein [Acinetobacter parvus]
MMIFPKTVSRPLFYSFMACSLGSASMVYAASNTEPQNPPQPQPPQTEAATSENFLDYIPKWVDATPTVFPEQSNQPIVPPTEETEDRTWIDRKQRTIREWTDRTSVKIDDWFGEIDPEKPASATIRFMLDNYWNEYDNYEVKPRIRGKIKLPTLEKRLSLVFGDDTLDDEFDNNIANINNQPNQDTSKRLDSKQARDNNGSIALRFSNFSKRLPFDTDADIGIRSGDDVYLRLRAKKYWDLDHDFNFNAEQIYRYGSKSENYLRTNLELIHARPNQPFLSNQLSLTYADTQDDDLRWDNRTFRQHQFFAHNSFKYGIYTGGYYDNNDLRLNSWGPFVSWRQPLWREWFYVQGDLNYFNDHREDRSHYMSTFVRFESLF